VFLRVAVMYMMRIRMNTHVHDVYTYEHTLSRAHIIEMLCSDSECQSCVSSSRCRAYTRVSIR